MKWFKMYGEARNDAKLRTLPDEQFRVWFNLMCLASEQDERGVIAGYSEMLLAVEVCNGDVTLLNVTLEKLVTLRIVTLTEDYKLTFVKFADRQHDRPSDSPSNIADRVRRHREKKKNAPQNPDVTPCNALHEICNATDKIRVDKNRIEETTNGDSSAAPMVSEPDESSDELTPTEEIYQAYPRKEAKGAALKAIEGAVKKITARGSPKPDGWNGAAWPPADPLEFLRNRVESYAVACHGKDKKYIPHPATWFNEGRYLNTPSQVQSGSGVKSQAELDAIRAKYQNRN